MSLLEKLTLDDLDEDQRELAECIGIESYKRLVRNYAGSYVYVCKPETITAAIRDEQIRREFNGYNYFELAKKYDLSEISVRRIISPILKAVKAAPLPGQISFFEDDTEN